MSWTRTGSDCGNRDIDLLPCLAVTRETTYEVDMAKPLKIDCIGAASVSGCRGCCIACLEILWRDLLHVVELHVITENKSIAGVEVLIGSPILVINATHACPTSRVTDLVNCRRRGDSAKSHHQVRNRQSFLHTTHDRKLVDIEWESTPTSCVGCDLFFCLKPWMNGEYRAPDARIYNSQVTRITEGIQGFPVKSIRIIYWIRFLIGERTNSCLFLNEKRRSIISTPVIIFHRTISTRVQVLKSRGQSQRVQVSPSSNFWSFGLLGIGMNRGKSRRTAGPTSA